MAEKDKAEDKSIIRGLFEETGGQLKKDTAIKVSKWVLAVLSATAGIVAKFLKGLPSFWQGVLWGVAGLAALLVLLLIGSGYIQYRRKRKAAKASSELAPPVSSVTASPPIIEVIPPAKPQRQLATPESVEQVRQLFHSQVQCTGSAMAYLRRRFPSGAQPEEHARLVSRLLEQYVESSFNEIYLDLYRRMQRADFEEDEFTELVDAFNRVTAKYIGVTNWLLWVGQVFYGDGFRRDDNYDSWHKAHGAFVEAVRRVQGRHDLRSIVETLSLLVNLLPEPMPPSADPPRSTAP